MSEDRNIADEVSLIFNHLLRRKPRQNELDAWIKMVQTQDLSFEQMFRRCVAGKEYDMKTRVQPGHPVGHYYSPVVDPEELKEYFAPNRKRPIEDLAGLNLTSDDIRRGFDEISPFMGGHKFSRDATEGERYFWHNGGYPLGDAIVLSAMIQSRRPERIIEIGSGYSTACMLDTIERAGLDTRITCVEPYADRLRSTLKPQDAERVTIHEIKVQMSDPEMYDSLDENDILFIDSTHIVKTGSDVVFELFEILPRLKPGVMVHFHDIQYPFEYNDKWIFENKWSWNEIYAIRAFLMFNSKFRVFYFNHYFGTRFRPDLEAAYGDTVASPGGGIWLKVVE